MIIKNIEDLKNFVSTCDVRITEKIKIINTCLNVSLLGSYSVNELIEIIDKNKDNKVLLIDLGAGINPEIT
jgi:hypothetical protein